MDLDNYYGRRVLVPRHELIQSGIQELPTIRIDTANIRCYRCNYVTEKSLGALPRGEFYCPHCINLGRVSINFIMFQSQINLRLPNRC